MIKDRIVRVKLQKRYAGHRPLNYVGKVTAFNDRWVVMDAKCIMLTRQQPNGVQADTTSSAMMIPSENIESIRVLPDNFDLNKFSFTTEGQQLLLVVDGKRDCYIGELGEG